MKKTKKLLTSILLTVALTASLILAGCGEKKDNAGSESAKGDTASAGNITIEIDVKDYGVMKAVLYPDVAPITVENFVKLAKEGFFDGLTFHRNITGFMIQGGEPSGDGTGGSPESIKGEFAANGVENNLSHKRGVLSMARSNDPDSASSQFFIVHQDSTFLDGQYAAFGEVTEGIEVVDAICEKVQVTDGNGTTPKESQPVINSIKVIE